MTGNRLRHLYFAIMMLKEFEGAKVLIEDFFDETGKNYTNDDVTPSIKMHFEKFEATEARFFSEFVEEHRRLLEKHTLRTVKPETINDTENINLIGNLKPRAIAVHSTSIIGKELIQSFPRRIINLHAGLSPYYRGAGTNLFPFYNGELEFVGMTVHYIDVGIDSGDIILQGRPVFEEDDNPHTIGCKNIILGTRLMTKVVKRFLLDIESLPSCKQDLSKGKLYLKKHFNDEVLVRIEEKLEQGLVKQYMGNWRKLEIMEWPDG